MSTRPDDDLQNSNVPIEDSYENVNTDMNLSIDKLREIKNKIEIAPWYRIGTHIKLRKELSSVEKESDKILERLKKLDVESRNPIQIVKRP
jgi:hypothetical protein